MPFMNFLHVIYEFCSGPPSPLSICSSVVEHLKVWGSIPHEDSDSFFMSHACDKMKNLSL